MEADYQVLIKDLLQERAHTLAQAQARERELEDYYTLWVHQVKTPIAAARLLLQTGAGGENTSELELELFKIERYVEMVLQYLRVESPSADLVIRPYSLDGIVRQAVRRYRKRRRVQLVKSGFSVRKVSLRPSSFNSEKVVALRMDYILEMRGISKAFYGVQALKDVDFSVIRGETHILLGENGAGKSTLMKILSGAYHKDAGEIYFDGERIEISTPLDAQQKGISIIYQEFNLIPGLTVAENIFLGREPLKGNRLIDWKVLNENAKAILDKLHANIPPKALVATLSVAEQQFVEIAKALSFGAKLIIMDEPSATLTPAERDRLFDVIRDLKQAGVSIIYISHHLDEIFEIGDRVTVLRDGQLVATDELKNVTKDLIIRWMVGRDLTNTYPPRTTKPGEVVLEVKNLSRRGELYDINFQLRRGEILGIAGLVGSGRTELVRALYGADPIDSGEIILRGRRMRIGTPKESIKYGIGLLPEDRKQQGLVLEQPVRSNVTLANLKRVVRSGLIRASEEKNAVDSYIKNLNIRTPGQHVLIKNLSGGNQQKAVLAKWLFTDSDILIFDEPTRGIDVGAKYEIYQLMNRLTEEGKSVIMVSSELPEIIGMSDRVLVLHKGRITGEYTRDQFDQGLIMKNAAGEAS